MAACSGLPPLADRAVVYNEALADASNRLILLNALRAKQRLPVYYTRISTAQTEGVVQSKISAPFDIGPGASEIVKLTAELAPSQKDTLGITLLDDQKFTRGVMTPIPPNIMRFYLDQGWPRELMLNLGLERIELSKAQLKILGEGLDEACAGQPDNIYCSRRTALRTTLLGCRALSDAGLVVMDNKPTDPARLTCFQAAVRAMLATGFHSEEKDREEMVARAVRPESAGNLDHVVAAAREGYTLRYKKDGTTALYKKNAALRFTLHVPISKTDFLWAAVAEPGKLGRAGCHADRAGDVNCPIRLVTRSPDAIIYYLGEILRAEDTGDPVSVWSELRAESQAADAPTRFIETRVFYVHKGPALGRSAVSLIDGVTPYWVAPPCVDEEACREKGDRSMQTVAFVNQVFGLLKEASIPSLVPSFTVLGN